METTAKETFTRLVEKYNKERKVKSKFQGAMRTEDALLFFSHCLIRLGHTNRQKLRDYLVSCIEEGRIDITTLPLSSFLIANPVEGLQEARILYEWVCRTQDRTIIQDVLDMLPLVKERHQLTNPINILGLIERKIKRSDECFFYLKAFMLQAWLRDDHSLDLCTDRMVNMTMEPLYLRPEERYVDVEKFIDGMDQGGYKKDKMIQANVRRMRHRMAEYLEVEDKDLAQTMLSCLILDSWTFESKTQRDLSFAIHSYCHNLFVSGYFIKFMTDPTFSVTEEHLEQMDNIIDEYLRDIQMEHFVAKGNETHYYDEDEEISFTITDFNKQFRTLEVSNLLTMCIVLYLMQDIDKIVKAQTRSTYLRELLSPDNVVDLESSYNRLSKEVTELKEELNTANMQLTAKTSQIQELQKQNHALASHPEKDRAIHDLHRQLSKMQKQIDAQQEQIECLTAQKQAVEEQNQMLLAVKRGEEEPIDIDPTKRYLFAVVEDAMKPKLKAWFPNCVLSQDASITQNNYNNIYMIILLTVDMTHKEGQWLKNKAISFNIPLVYCNSVSYRRICETIAAQEKLLGLR